MTPNTYEPLQILGFQDLSENPSSRFAYATTSFSHETKHLPETGMRSQV